MDMRIWFCPLAREVQSVTLQPSQITHLHQWVRNALRLYYTWCSVEQWFQFLPAWMLGNVETHLVAGHEQGAQDKYPWEGLSSQCVQKYVVFHEWPVACLNDGHIGDVCIVWENRCIQVHESTILGRWIHVFQWDVHLKQVENRVANFMHFP